ncbi:hypothetical protein [Geminicoccus flavidas]|nr:hypothetical protein [Geminicoccus flavidas]
MDRGAGGDKVRDGTRVEDAIQPLNVALTAYAEAAEPFGAALQHYEGD